MNEFLETLLLFIGIFAVVIIPLGMGYIIIHFIIKFW